MYQWLKDELRNVKTRRFHQVEKISADDLVVCLDSENLELPISYVLFLQEFGTAKLYKEMSYYLVGVTTVHEERVPNCPDSFLYFGHFDSQNAAFKKGVGQSKLTSSVYEITGNRSAKVAEDFGEWLKMRCEDARKRYSKHEWDGIVAGPKPFSSYERGVVEARKMFTWRIIGQNLRGEIQFEVANRSRTILPYLSVGIRARSGGFEGAVWLPISKILPGSSGIVEMNCYKESIPPTDVEAFTLPDPEPEDRDRYWEFRKK